MKLRILISNDGRHALYYIRLGLARAFAACGHDVVMWDINSKPPHDAFDEFNPHIFLGQTYNLNKNTIKAIQDRPHLRVVLRASDWGTISQNIDKNEYPVLIANPDEIKNVLTLLEEYGKPNYLEIHYHPDYIKDTHGSWIEKGLNVYSQMNAADIFDFHNATFMEEFASDITYVGGYWEYKSKIIDQYLIPLCKSNKYRIKIFGNSVWPVPQYCGFIDGKNIKNALFSSTICPNLHEPHSHKYGYDIVERPFKLMLNKSFVISDNVSGLKQLFPNEIVYADNPIDFREKIDFYLQNPDKRYDYINKAYDAVINGHTYFHRAAEILSRLGYQDLSIQCINKLKELV